MVSDTKGLAAPSKSPVLTVSDAAVWFGTAKGMVRAVDGVSLTLDRGETLGIVGESGSGKSMLGRLIMDILPRRRLHQRGRVELDGADISSGTLGARRARGSDVAMVFQDASTALNPVVRAGRQITESLRYHRGTSKTEATRRAIELLQQVGIPDPQSRLRAYPHQLSGGMRQRLAIAIAIACSPKVLIADEPTTALDVTIQRQILDLLEQLQRERGMALILITHDLGVVASRADRIAVMYAGRIVEQATPTELILSPKHPYTAALLRSIPRLQDAPGTRLHALRGLPPTISSDRQGCAFAPRCERAQSKCTTEVPPLVPAGTGRSHACFYPIDTQAGGRLNETAVGNARVTVDRGGAG